jgi:hypothetical protein
MIKQKKKTIPKSLKIAVWNKYIGEDIGKTKCLCCNLTDITQLKFHTGNIIAEVNGGDINIDNLRPICETCNKSMGTKNMDGFKTLINIVEEKFEPDINILQKIYIGLRCKWNRYSIYGPYRTIAQGEEKRTIQLFNTNKEFIKLLVDETKINHTLYEDLQKTNDKLFLSNVQSLIDKNKYNKYDISKYILDYDKRWNEKTHNMSVQIPELTNKYLFLSNN